MRKDKKQIIGEPMTTEAIRQFLLPEPAQNDVPPALHKLIRAYRSLRIDDFEQFVGFLCEAGYDLNAADAKGRRFTDLVAGHRLAAPYIERVNALA